MAFLITGKPRSRTAWFAVATGALHEPARLPPIWTGGVSDSRASLHLAEIYSRFEPRTLIIERPKFDVLTSAIRYTDGMPGDWRAVQSMLGAMEARLAFQHPAIKRVAYDDLNDIAVVRDCLEWLGVAEPPNLEQLMHMRIESDLAWNLARMKDAA